MERRRASGPGRMVIVATVLVLSLAPLSIGTVGHHGLETDGEGLEVHHHGPSPAVSSGDAGAPSSTVADGAYEIPVDGTFNTSEVRIAIPPVTGAPLVTSDDPSGVPVGPELIEETICCPTAPG